MGLKESAFCVNVQFVQLRSENSSIFWPKECVSDSLDQAKTIGAEVDSEVFNIQS